MKRPVSFIGGAWGGRKMYKLKLVHRTTLMAFYGDVLGRRTDRRIGGIGAVLEALEVQGPSGCGRDKSRPCLGNRRLHGTYAHGGAAGGAVWRGD